MKTLFSLLESKDLTNACSLSNTKVSLSKLPRALIIKLEDISPSELYKSLNDQYPPQPMTNHNDKEWYMMNRQRCVTLIKKCCDRFQLRDNTFYAALSYADRLLNNSSKITTKAYDLIIISCIVLATKYAENDAYELDLNDFYSLEGNTIYHMYDIKQREVKSVKELGYELTIPTPFDFLVSQMTVGVIFKDEFPNKNDVNKFYSHAKILLHQVMSSKWGMVYTPEVIALSVIYYTRKYFEFDDNRLQPIKDKLHFTADNQLDDCLSNLSE